MMSFTKATRKKANWRMALTGVSGSGKTLGALYIGYGMTGDWSKVALIDTEHGRAQFYADRSDLGIGEFLYSELTPPFSPERYIEAAREGAAAVGEGGVLIVDSLSHAWNAEGGVLDIQQRIANSGKAGMNSYTAWADAGKEQNNLINVLFSLPCHVIVTMRVKTEYALEVNERGKQQPVKLGLTPVQRADMEYEFDTVLSINREHIATANKDVTFLDKYGQVITPELGRQIAGWLSNGVEPEKCALCGHTINAAGGKNVFQIIEGSMKFSGRKMCLECFQKWYKLNTGRMAQYDEVFSSMGYDKKHHDEMLQTFLAESCATPAGANADGSKLIYYPADATGEQWQYVLDATNGNR